MTSEWSEWRRFPDPREGGLLTAPLGPGCYELRRSDTGKLILFGMGGHVALRMTSLLPAPLGHGRRNNADKRNYILTHIENVEYRTLACLNREQAAEYERRLKAGKADFEFQT
jgi:hypothetical protein